MNHILSISIFLHAMLARAQFPQPFGPPMPMGSMHMGPMPMSMPMPMMSQQPRMPVVVMPYHSKTADKFRTPHRKRPKRYRESESSSSSDSDESSSSSSDEMNFRASKVTKKQRRQVLTPVVSYVTKDGYVVYQKKIRKERAKEWLDIGKGKGPEPKEQSNEMSLNALKRKVASIKKKKRHHGHHHH